MGETVSSRFEDIVRSIIDGTPYGETVHSKEEELLLELKEVIEQGGGGGVTRLSQLEDVDLSNLKDGDFLVYNGTTDKFRNQEATEVVINYDNATNKPTVNGQEIDGQMTLQDLGIAIVDAPNETISFGSED